MIGYFPHPYPDELWYSVCARFANHIRFPTETGVMQALYGRRHAVATVDLPHHLSALACQLPTDHPCNADAIIDQNTFLPYYSPFLLTKTFVAVRRFMADGSKASVRVRCGACTNRVRPPKSFRSCPLCNQENRDRRGETYWRRLFQLPGVEVCPTHRVFLGPSDIRLDPLPNRHKYFAAESARLVTAAHPVDSKDPRHQILIDLARDIEWLLLQERLNPGLSRLHERYREILREKGFATRAGSIRMFDLRRTLVSYYGQRLLKLLQSELPEEMGDGWLGHLLRKSNTAVAPLRHLLLLRALQFGLAKFFFPQPFTRAAEPLIRPVGPWRCLNIVCEHYGKMSISQSGPQSPGGNGVDYLILECPHCGFKYQSDGRSENPERAARVIDYGRKWRSVLKEQWANSTITLRGIAITLGVDPKTVKQRATELALPFPINGKRPVTRRGLYVPKKRNKTKWIDVRRKAWAALRQKHPTKGTKQLRSQKPALYAWLYRNDRQWLAEHRPRRRPPTVTPVHVDWVKRDEELSAQIATVAFRLKNQQGKPQRTTVTAIGRALGKQSLFEGALSKLHLTRSVIKSVLESGEEFAVRRVHAAAAKLRRVQGTFARWELIRAAGLHYRLAKQPVVQAALDYEVRPPVKISISTSRKGPVATVSSQQNHLYSVQGAATEESDLRPGSL